MASLTKVPSVVSLTKVPPGANISSPTKVVSASMAVVAVMGRGFTARFRAAVA